MSINTVSVLSPETVDPNHLESIARLMLMTGSITIAGGLLGALITHKIVNQSQIESKFKKAITAAGAVFGSGAGALIENLWLGHYS